MWRRTYGHRGHSPLVQINTTNVGGLRLAWAWTMREGRQETTPLVHDGMMFLVEPCDFVEALDVRVGSRTPVSKQFIATRRPSGCRAATGRHPAFPACRVGGGAPRGRWPPSTAQSLRAVFLHTAFYEDCPRRYADRWKESDRQGSPSPTRRRAERWAGIAIPDSATSCTDAPTRDAPPIRRYWWKSFRT